MFDPVFLAAALLHASALSLFWGWAGRRWKVPGRDAPFFILLALWASLAGAGHLAGIGGNLGKLSVYVPASFGAAGLVFLLLGAIQKTPAKGPLLKRPAPFFAPIASLGMRRFLFWFLLISLLVFASVSLVLGLSVYPDNADSMIYRLPRAVFYVSHGSFMHPFESLDKRLLFYPLDGVALYVPLVLYGLPGTFHALPSFLAWAVVVYAAYRFARELGADRLFALMACWLVGLTPSVLAQANATNDEIIAAAALLSGLYMGWRWLMTGRPLYFALAGLAVGLSAGTKLHLVFLLPLAALALLFSLLPSRNNRIRLLATLGKVDAKTWIIAALLTAAAFAPFLFYNYASSGRFYFFDDFKKDVFNLSASLHGGLQNLLIYLAQMTLSPIADLNVWPVANDRQTFNTALNELFNPLVSWFIEKDPRFYHMGYRFSGITLPVSVRFVEFSLWAGFVWLLWPFQAALAWRRAGESRYVFLLLAMTPPLWILLWSFATLYMEGTATYFSFYLVCAAPACVFALASIKRPLLNEIRWVCVALVIVSDLLICHNLVMYSGFRAVPDLFYARTWPFDWLLTEKPIIEEIRGAKNIRIVFTHEKLPTFGLMHWNPTAHYMTPYAPTTPGQYRELDESLQILPISSLNMYGYMPLRIPGKPTTGATYLGAIRGIGREAIFMLGSGVEKRHPNESNYMILGTGFQLEPDGTWLVTFGKDIVGYAPKDHLTFEYELRQGEKLLSHRPADANPVFTIRMARNPHESGLSLTIIVRSAWNGQELTRALYGVGGAGAWLPEGPEY